MTTAYATHAAPEIEPAHHDYEAAMMARAPVGAIAAYEAALASVGGRGLYVRASGSSVVRKIAGGRSVEARMTPPMTPPPTPTYAPAATSDRARAMQAIEDDIARQMGYTVERGEPTERLGGRESLDVRADRTLADLAKGFGMSPAAYLTTYYDGSKAAFVAFVASLRNE